MCAIMEVRHVEEARTAHPHPHMAYLHHLGQVQDVRCARRARYFLGSGCSSISCATRRVSFRPFAFRLSQSAMKISLPGTQHGSNQLLLASRLRPVRGFYSSNVLLEDVPCRALEGQHEISTGAAYVRPGRDRAEGEGLVVDLVQSRPGPMSSIGPVDVDGDVFDHGSEFLRRGVELVLVRLHRCERAGTRQDPLGANLLHPIFILRRGDEGILGRPSSSGEGKKKFLVVLVDQVSSTRCRPGVAH